MRTLIILLLFLLLVLVAIALAAQSATFGAPRAALAILAAGAPQASPERGSSQPSDGVSGGGADGLAFRTPELGRVSSHPAVLHSLGLALERHARSLGPEHIVGLHPLDRGRYEPLAFEGGALRPSPGGHARHPKNPRQPWTDYKSWEALAKDQGATAQYFKQRAAVLNDPKLDWGPVLKLIGPKLRENREYIGLVNLGPDGKTLQVVTYEASPIEAGTMESATAFAAVPSELVAKYASRPALFIFHTHPADPRANPLPSSHDLSTSIYFSALARFAGHAVISTYGVLVFGLDWSGYKAINEAKDWKLAAMNLSHDIVAAHEAIRSWSAYTLSDYLAFYPRHRLVMFVYPSPEMVGDTRRLAFQWDLELPIDHDVIEEHRRDIAAHVEQKGKQRGRARTRADDAPREARVDLGFD